jgi:hypothetical protein
MFDNVFGIARRFASAPDIRIGCARNPIIAFIVSDPRIKEGTLDDFGAAIHVDPANAPQDRLPVQHRDEPARRARGVLFCQAWK